jgi:hypothetical protein
MRGQLLSRLGGPVDGLMELNECYELWKQDSASITRELANAADNVADAFLTCNDFSQAME